MLPSHVTIAVPAGHTVQVHPPGQVGLPNPAQPGPSSGMIHDPRMEGAKAAMDAALAPPTAADQAEERNETPAEEAREAASGEESKEVIHKPKKKKKAIKK